MYGEAARNKVNVYSSVKHDVGSAMVWRCILVFPCISVSFCACFNKALYLFRIVQIKYEEINSGSRLSHNTAHYK